jgi:hypothetical protein
VVNVVNCDVSAGSRCRRLAGKWVDRSKVKRPASWSRAYCNQLSSLSAGACRLIIALESLLEFCTGVYDRRSDVGQETTGPPDDTCRDEEDLYFSRVQLVVLKDAAGSIPKKQCIPLFFLAPSDPPLRKRFETSGFEIAERKTNTAQS